MADVWCISVPLLWNVRHTILRNLALVLTYSVGLFVFNALRLTGSDLVSEWGVPWALGHEALLGVCIFAVWLWICRQQRW